MKRLAFLVLCASALLAIPAFASAATLCVNAPAGDCTTQYSSGQLQAAFTDAENNNQDNALRIGAGTYTGAFTYNGNGHTLSIEGAGEGATSINVPNNAAHEAALKLAGPDVTVQDLDVQLSAANSDGDLGLDTTLTDIRRVHVIGNGSDNTTAIRLVGGSLTDATIDQDINSLNGTLGVFAGGNATITDVTISAQTGVNFSAPTATLDASRLTINAKSRGVETDGGTINIDDSVIDLGPHDGVGLFAENGNPSTNAKAINANHLTIVGSGPNSIGVRARSMVPTAKQTSTITLNNSVISGMATSIQRFADNDGAQGGSSVANVTTSYSNYDASKIDESNGPNGAGSITATNQTNLAPGFVDAVGGDYRLVSSSALVDAGNPASGGPALDVAGQDRVVDGDGDFVDRRDIGAYELPDTTAPPVQITAGPSGTVTDPAVQFQFSSTDPAATFRCRFDSDSFGPCTTAGSHSATVAEGAHTFEVQARDAHGNSGVASQAFTVVTPPGPVDTPPGDTPPGDTPPDDNPPADTKAPKTTIAGAGKVKTTHKRVRVSFSADDPTARFECKLDGGAFAACASPYKTPKLKRGKHTVTVRAIDPAGNTEATPPSVKIKVKPKAES
jgi:hypothetical protein